MNVRPEVRLDKAQFFAWAEHQECRYELVDGRVVLQPNVTRGHNRICINVVRTLSTLLDPARFDVAQGDFAVETGDRSVRYADVMVEPFSDALGERTTTRAILLVEVLSPSSLHIDFHEKLDEYSALGSLQTYVICAQNEPRVWVWTRTEGLWPLAPQILDSRDQALALPALGIALSLSEIYRNIP